MRDALSRSTDGSTYEIFVAVGRDDEVNEISRMAEEYGHHIQIITIQAEPRERYFPWMNTPIGVFSGLEEIDAYFRDLAQK